MSFVDNGNNNGFYMPVSPAYGGYGNNGGFGGFGNDGAWWLLVLLFALGGWGNNGWGGNAGAGMMPYMINSNNTNNDVQRGFDQQAVMSGINSLNSNVSNGFSNVQQSMCSNTAGITAAVNNGFSAAEIAANGRQMADMNQNFAMQTAINNGITGLQSQISQCCCDNRLATANLNSTILSENCADRAAVSDGIRDVITNANANTQRMVDTTNAGIQALETKFDQYILSSKDEKIADLQNQILMSNIRNAIGDNTNTIAAGQRGLANEIEQYVNPTARPAYIVQNPNGCNCGNYSNCGNY